MFPYAHEKAVHQKRRRTFIMKKFMIIMFVLATMAFAQVSHAAFYTCTCQLVGQSALRLTDAGGAFTQQMYALSAVAATRNQQLAIALTAAAAGKQLYVSLPAVTAGTTIAALYVIP
jgi:hypothetical protein